MKSEGASGPLTEALKRSGQEGGKRRRIRCEGRREARKKPIFSTGYQSKEGRSKVFLHLENSPVIVIFGAFRRFRRPEQKKCVHIFYTLKTVQSQIGDLYWKIKELAIGHDNCYCYRSMYPRNPFNREADRTARGCTAKNLQGAW